MVITVIIITTITPITISQCTGLMPPIEASYAVPD